MPQKNHPAFALDAHHACKLEEIRLVNQWPKESSGQTLVRLLPSQPDLTSLGEGLDVEHQRLMNNHTIRRTRCGRHP